MPIHNIQPIFDTNSEILILGSFPSVKSREGQFFYDHPQNRFWKVLARVFQCDVPQTHAKKKTFLLEHRIALWDVLASCDIHGSADSSIKNSVPNDLTPIIDTASIKAIFCNGGTSFTSYNRYLSKKTGIEAIKLPSTSPANAAFSLQKLIDEWSIILSYLNL